VRKRSILAYSAIALLIVMVMTPLIASAGNPQQEPTATPTDPGWVAFSTARAAIEEAKGEDLTWVQNWTYEESEWKDGIDGCRTLNLEAGEADRQVYFGWTVTITSLFGKQYQARVSFNYKLVSVCDKVVETESAAVTANPNSNLPAPVAGAANTGAFELGGQITGFYQDARDAMKQSGMKWAKMQLSVGADGSGFIAEAHNNGFKILFSVIGDPAQIMNDSYQTTYANYVASLAKAGADAIEIWNEQNIDREWPQGAIDPARYVQLLAKAYNAIKAANPNTMVISGAPAPTGAEGAFGLDRVWNDDRYVAGMAAAGAGRYADCIGVHYNEGIVSPRQRSGDPRGDNYPTRYFDTMLARGTAGMGKPACFTEIGYLTPEGYGPLPGSFGWAGSTTVAQQAQWLAEAASRAAASGRVRLMIVFNVDFDYYGDDPQAGFAMIRPGGACPACETLGELR
jgi:hypothetical protein